MRPILKAAVFCAVVSSLAVAQQPPKGPRYACIIASNEPWVVKQRAWLDEPQRAWTDDSLRVSLLRSVGLQASTRLQPQLGWQTPDNPTPTIDIAMIPRLQQIAATRGSVWPTKSVVGAAGVRAVWLLAQRDTALARTVLKRMMEAGPEESNAADVAILEDRVRLQSGRKQIYGTQFRVAADGHVSLAPMEDSAHVDLRREDAALPPFEKSACVAQLDHGKA
jgi:hypothetical protein